MSNILVSVIVATYNQERFIGRCIRSLMQQSLEKNKYEIIVINDGSTDKTNFALNLFHKAIIVINNKKNYGLPKSINKGIKKANGKYIVRVDSDDFVNKNFLHFLSYFLETNFNEDAVACDYLKVDDDEKVIARLNCENEPIACGILFKKKDLLKIGLYDENFTNAFEHVDHSYQLAKNGFSTPYWWWADIANSLDFVQEQKCSEDSSAIRPRSDWQSNIQQAAQYFMKKNNVSPVKVPDTPQQEVVEIIKRYQKIINEKRSKRKANVSDSR